MLEQWLREQEPDHGLSNESIKLAVGHLANALHIAEQIRDDMNSGVVSIWALSEESEECWNELNRCRIYTESILFIEELIIPAMGYIYDAKSMFDSLIAWKLGMTLPAFRSILSCLHLAEYAVKQCLDELLSWQDLDERD